ncbi:peptidylprolyl isomerase [Bacillus thuringiensis]|uniref:peptidylprolyl isomerase n=1 Tax=Bacillus thuringiensis TaxID=1428 RepID=UPI0034589457
MKKWITAVTLAGSFSLLAGCSTSPTYVKTKFGDVTKNDLDTYLENKNGDAAIREVVLQKILEKKYPVTDREIEERLKQVKDAHGAPFSTSMHIGKKEEERLREDIKHDLIRTKALKQLITDADLTAANIPKLTIRHILLDSREKADEVKKRLDNGESFDKLVKSESMDSLTKSNGGVMDSQKWIGFSEIEKAAQKLEVNKISDPIDSKIGFHLIEVMKKEAAKNLKDVSQKEKDALIEKVIHQKKRDGSMEKLFQKILNEAQIEVKEEIYEHAFDKK